MVKHVFDPMYDILKEYVREWEILRFAFYITGSVMLVFTILFEALVALKYLPYNMFQSAFLWAVTFFVWLIVLYIQTEMKLCEAKKEIIELGGRVD